MQEAKHGAARLVAELPDLLGGVALVIVEKEHLALSGTQRGEQSIEIAFHAGFFGFGGGQRGRVRFVQGGKGHDFAAAAHVDEEMADCGAEDRSRVHAAISPREIQPRILHEILGIGGPMRERERVAVAGLEKVGVGRWRWRRGILQVWVSMIGAGAAYSRQRGANLNASDLNPLENREAQYFCALRNQTNGRFASLSRAPVDPRLAAIKTNQKQSQTPMIKLPSKFTARVLASALALAATIAFADDGRERRSDRGTVYVADNSTTANRILLFNRGADGSLTAAGSVATGGRGSGGGLGNAGGIAMQEDGRFLLAVNAGSNEISVLAATRSGLVLVDKQHSGGVRPISVTISDDLVYVLNAGGGFGDADNITGFTIGRNGRLKPLANSTRPLSTANAGPAQVAFNPEGDVLMVTEKGTNKITTYTVGEDGRTLSQQSVASHGATPFGFAFSGRAKVFVTNAAGGAPNASSVSSYYVDETGATLNLADAVTANQTAACWIAITDSGRYAYASNTGSDSVTRFQIGSLGSLTPLGNVSTGGLSGPIDSYITPGDKFLYVLNGRGDARTISAYAIAADGSLTALAGATGLPVGSNGLIAR